MSWSDDMRCLHCDGKLPLYRKITNGQFCSAAHRRAYWKEQERLAVERLSQTHDSLRAYQPPAALQATPRAVAARPLAPDTEAIARSASNTDRVKIPGFKPGRLPDLQCMSADHSMAIEPAPTAWPVGAPALPLRVVAQSSNEMALAVKADLRWANGKAIAAPARIAIGEIAPVTVPAAVTTRLSLAAGPQTPELDYEVAMAGKADLPLVDRNTAVEPAAVMAGEIAPVMVPTPVTTRLSLAAAPQTPELDATLLQPQAGEQPAIEERQQLTAEPQVIPPSETLFALPRIAARDIEHGEHDAHVRMKGGSAAIETDLSAQTAKLNFCLEAPVLATACPQTLTLRAAASVPGHTAGNAQAVDLRTEPGAPAVAITTPLSQPGLLSTAGLQTMTLRAAAPAAGHVVDIPQAIDLRTDPGSPAMALTTPMSKPRPRLAKGSRYAIQQQPPAATAAGQGESHPAQELPTSLLSMDLAARVPAPDAAPGAGKILPLAWNATPRVPAAARTAASAEFSAPEFQGLKPMQPAMRVDPLEGNPEPPSKRNWVSAWMQRASDEPHAKHIWAPAVDFWGHAPRDLKLLAVVIPVLLALALHPSLPKVRVAAPTATRHIQTDVERSFHNQLVSVKQSLAERAGVALSEDFRSGLDEWQLRGEHATSWSFDANGFVRPATLALYRPSMPLGDYEMQFLGLIDKKALSWVARARDFDNYYVMKLVVLKPGPLPTLGVTRYAVIDGKAQNRVDTMAPIEARPDMLYRVSLDVHGDTFLLGVQGKVVDSWSEPRLTRGGVGFFSPRGEESRLRWVQVTHQYDMLGRLCAYLAPYNIPTTNGSW